MSSKMKLIKSLGNRLPHSASRMIYSMTCYHMAPEHVIMLTKVGSVRLLYRTGWAAAY
jgi:amino acid permease